MQRTLDNLKPNNIIDERTGKTLEEIWNDFKNGTVWVNYKLTECWLCRSGMFEQQHKCSFCGAKKLSTGK